jgi:hypothetical protein
MDKWFEKLVRAEVDTYHWALWEKPDEVNRHIKDFLVDKVEIPRSSL